jgi:hypothetical protein
VLVDETCHHGNQARPADQLLLMLLMMHVMMRLMLRLMLVLLVLLVLKTSI